MSEFNENIKKEVIDKDKLPTNEHHPGQEISEENDIILGDIIEGEEPSPPTTPRKKNYLWPVVIIIIVLIGVFWGVKGCNERGKQNVFTSEVLTPVSTPVSNVLFS